ncbi:MAG: hypothetical protein WCJ07_10445 [Verrucomicrobiota bacterium]
MLKRRMRKVAIAHFGFSLVFLFVVLNYGFRAHSFSGGFTAILEGESRAAWMDAWASVWRSVFYLFQPLHLLVAKTHTVMVGTYKWFFLFLALVSIPVWSICFSWIFVKLDSWLNHFPFLGKKFFEP